MNNQRQVITLIKAISGQANVLTIPRLFIQLTGDIKQALFLSQCIYWSDKTSREDGFFYKSISEWSQELGLSREELDTIRRQLCYEEWDGAHAVPSEPRWKLVEVKKAMANGHPTLHYRVNFENLCVALESMCGKDTNAIVENPQMDLGKTHKSITETTPETTKDFTPPPAQPVTLEKTSPPAELRAPHHEMRLYAPVPRGKSEPASEDEPVYEDSEALPSQIRKWMQPSSDFQERFLHICRRKYFRKGEKSRVIAIEKGMRAADARLAISGDAQYPLSDYVEGKLKWAIEMNKQRPRITALALLSAIEKEDNWNDWVARRGAREHKEGTQNGVSTDYSTSRYASNAKRA